VRRVPLGEVVDCLDRRRVPVKESERTPGPVPYYGANGQQGWIDRAIFDEPLVIVAEDGGHFGERRRGVAYRISGPSWVNNHGHVLRANSMVDHDYLFHSLRNFDFAPYISGSTRSKLTQKQLMQAEIPLPPLPEQRRIAAILDHADGLRAKRRQVYARLDALTRALFAERFGSMDANVELQTVCTRITDGTHQSPGWRDAGVPFLFVSNITSGEINMQTQKFISQEIWAKLTRRTPIEVGDVLYSTVGSYGIPALVRTNEKFAFQRHIAHIKPDPAKLDSAFLAAQMASPRVKRQATRAARGVAQPTVNLADIKKFSVVVPPIEQQRSFAAAAGAIRIQKLSVQTTTGRHDELFASLQSRAFRGEL
jgi:type I restriction enzyme S subunit